MTKPIEDHARVLGVRGKTVERLKAINIHTLDDLADASIEKVRLKLECTKERAQVLINRAGMVLAGKHHVPAMGYSKASEGSMIMSAEGPSGE